MPAGTKNAFPSRTAVAVYLLCKNELRTNIIGKGGVQGGMLGNCIVAVYGAFSGIHCTSNSGNALQYVCNGVLTERVQKLPDRVEILGHHGADRSISVVGLKNCHVSSLRYRNRRIGGFLRELHLT